MRWEKRAETVLGLKISYAIAGSGPPVVLVHGAAASHLTWWENIGPLSESYTVYAPDLPAHGDSEPPHDGDIESFGDPRFLEAFMDAVGISSAALVGNSGGGSIVAVFALEHPERVTSLTLVDSGGLGRSVSWFLRLASLPVVGELLHLHTIDSDEELVASIFHKPRPIDPALSAELRGVRNSWTTRMAVVKAIRAGMNVFGTKRKALLIDRLQELRVPLLIVWGEKDRVLPVRHAIDAARRLPNAIVHIMQGCGHWPHMENSSEFNEVLLRFLRSPQDLKQSLGVMETIG